MATHCEPTVVQFTVPSVAITLFCEFCTVNFTEPVGAVGPLMAGATVAMSDTVIPALMEVGFAERVVMLAGSETFTLVAVLVLAE